MFIVLKFYGLGKDKKKRKISQGCNLQKMGISLTIYLSWSEKFVLPL